MVKGHGGAWGQGLWEVMGGGTWSRRRPVGRPQDVCCSPRRIPQDMKFEKEKRFCGHVSPGSVLFAAEQNSSSQALSEPFLSSHAGRVFRWGEGRAACSIPCRIDYSGFFFFFFFSNTSFLGSALWKMAPGAETPKLHLEKAQGMDNLGLGTWLWELSQGLSQCWGLGH